jgi:hypothetical protein
MRRLIAAAVTVTAASTLAVAVQPASATSHQPCTIVKHGTTAGVVKQGAATSTLGADGIKLTTGSDNNDKVSWQDTFRRPVLAGAVKELSYETIKLDKAGAGVNDSALPSYHLYVRTPAGPATLVYEPYWHTTKLGLGGVPQRGLRTEWNVLDGPLWTSAKTVTGMASAGGGPGTLTLPEIVRQNPKMTITGIGFGLGTYNTNVIAVVDEQRFATDKECTEHQWSTGFNRGPWWPGWLRRG